MGYKRLTQKGIEFIQTICSGNGNNLLRGSNSYKLIFSNDPPNTIYTAFPKNRFGDPITTNENLGSELIKWFTDYAEEFDLDANIIAAQAYVESGFRLWAFPSPKLGSSAQGISQILSSTLYDIIIGNNAPAGNISILFSEDEIERLTKNLTNPRSLSSYEYLNNTNSNIAVANRVQLFQNCMDNPDLMIKAQCRYMKGISIKAADVAASTLFGYNQGFGYVDSTWAGTLLKSKNISGYKDGIEYVNKVFRVLGDENNSRYKPSGQWFGYEIDFDFDEFEADVRASGSDVQTLDLSKKLSKNYTLGDLIRTSQAQINVPTQEEFEKLEDLANNLLEPINNLLGTVVRVNSAFRSDAVNSSVGGTTSSQHRLAEAADIRIDGGSIPLAEAYDTIVNSGVIPYDQIIYELRNSTTWIHISYNPSRDRRQNLVARNSNGNWDYSVYSGNISELA